MYSVEIKSMRMYVFYLIINFIWKSPDVNCFNNNNNYFEDRNEINKLS